MAASNTELELKFVGAPGDIAEFRRLGAISWESDDAGAWSHIVTTYYDTPDGALRRAGVSLRLREEGGERTQTIKSSREGESFAARNEIEISLPPDAAFPAATGEAVIDALINAQARALTMIARTETDRWSTNLTPAGAVIEASFDIGTCESWACVKGATGGWFKRDNALKGRIAEAELELVEGDPRTLFAVAREVVAETEGRLALGAASKLDQALALTRNAAYGGAAFAPVGKANKIKLTPEDAPGDVLCETINLVVRRLAALRSPFLDGRNPEALRQMRIALRRFRSIERVFRRALKDRKFRALAVQARSYQHLLGRTRDLDVFVTQTLPSLEARGYASEGLGVMRARAEAMRAESWDEAARVIAGDEFQAFALSLLEYAQCRPWEARGRLADENLRAFAIDALDRRLRAARKTALKVDAAAPQTGHRLRIQLKKLRYAAQSFRALFPKEERKAYMAALSQLQDAFGGLNDAMVAQALAEETAKGQGAAAAKAAGFVSGYRATEADDMLQTAGLDWRALMEMTPYWRFAPSQGEALNKDEMNDKKMTCDQAEC